MKTFKLIYNDTKIKLKNKLLLKSYFTDALTGLPNRCKLLKDIENKHITLAAIVDINHFNQITSFYGNSFGDNILEHFSKQLINIGKKNNLKIYRIYSDVFALLSNNVCKNQQILNILKEFNSFNNIKFNLFNEETINLTITIGISFNENELLRKAFMALNYAKKHNKYMQVYNDNLKILEKYKDNLLWSNEILKAIDEDRVIPYFQPIYNNATKQIENYECLIRVLNKKGHIVPPFYFLDTSKQIGVYNTLTKIMIQKSFDTFKNINCNFSINLSIQDILDIEIKTFIIDKLKTYKIGNRVIFEITESEEIHKFTEITEFINKMHDYGAKIAIDDFGTGYSNFQYIINLNIDYIKIDGSIIKKICNDNNAEIIVESIVDLTKKLNIKTIAEYVYDEATFNKVNELNIDFSQGYYIGEPKENILK